MNSETAPEETRRRELGEAPVGALFLKMSIPATAGMFANGLYNLVDTIFIGRGVGTHAIGGLALAFPVQMLIMTFGLMTGQGAASVVSRNLGSGNGRRVRRAAGNAFSLALLFGGLILISGLVFIEPLLNLLGAASPLRAPAREYLSIVLLGSPFFILTMVSNHLLRSEGRARSSMLVMLTGIVVNLVLDPVFIFLFRFGVAGAAWATVIGQLTAFMLALVLFLKGQSLIRFKAKHLMLKLDVTREILFLGLPTFFRQIGQSVTILLLNNLLNIHGGALYISAYGAVNRLIMFLFMPMFGMVQGFQPIAGFNYGAGLFGRVRKILKIAVIYTSVYMSTGFLLLVFFPGFFAGLFSTDPELIKTASFVMRYMTALMPLVGIQVIGSTYFIVAGKGLPGLVLSLSRQVLLLIPLLLILPEFLGLKGVLLSFPVADFFAAVITVFWLLSELRRLRKPQDQAKKEKWKENDRKIK